MRQFPVPALWPAWSPFGSSLLLTLALACAMPALASAQLCGDVNDNGSVTTSDALSVLRVAVGQDIELVCDGECAALDPRVTSLETALAQAQSQLAEFQALLEGVSRTDDALVLSGANLQVVDGTGATAGPPNGLGNVIIGYNEGTDSQVRTGSHNLVVGLEHDYTSFGGIVAGEHNFILARGASVVGGRDNEATGIHSAVCGGAENIAEGQFASIGGGFLNEATGSHAAVSGGCENQATSTYSAVSGGRFALASGQWSSVAGGYTNKATGLYSSVSGGSTRTASTQFSWKAGSLSEAQ
ncbi:MAG: hypothetical protein ABR587_07045 [Candidatus Binatia bacterium]